ncbi:MAG: porin [Paracoccaceae bacterium]
MTGLLEFNFEVQCLLNLAQGHWCGKPAPSEPEVFFELKDRLQSGGGKSETVDIRPPEALVWAWLMKTEGIQMKKILIATTALVGTAGIAAAELNISGSARIGLGYVEDNLDDAGNEAEFRIEQRLRVNFTGVAETDSGVKLEARFRLESNEDEDNSISGRGPGAAGFAVSSGGFRLDVGNVSDVIDSGDVVNYYGFGIGFTAFLEHNGTVSGIPAGGFSAGDEDQTTIKVRYEVGDFTVSASYSNDENAVDAATFAPDGFTNDLEEYQIGVGYNFGDYSVGLAYGNQDGDVFNSDDGVVDTLDNDFWVATFDGSIGAVDFSIIVADSDAQDDVSYGGSLNYEISAATAIQFVVASGGNDANDTIYGIGASHSLGGGVTLGGGIGQNASGNTVADLGVSFSF